MKYICIVALLVILSGSSYAQGIGFVGMNYNMGYSGPSSRDYVDSYSWRGFNFEMGDFLTPHFAVGIISGWNTFHERNTGVKQLDQGAVSGTQARHFGSFPILALGRYYFGEKMETVRAYVGGSIGTYSINQRFEIGTFMFEKRNWHFGLAPEAGVVVPVGPEGVGFIRFGMRYNHAFAAGESLAGEGRAYSYWDFGVGIALVEP